MFFNKQTRYNELKDNIEVTKQKIIELNSLLNPILDTINSGKVAAALTNTIYIISFEHKVRKRYLETELDKLAYDLKKYKKQIKELNI